MIGERDFEAAGLLADLGGRERAARLRLLHELAALGATVEQMAAAAAERRLGVLAIELAFSQERHYTAREMLARTGLSEEFVQRNYRSLGLPVPDFDAPELGESELEAWQMLGALLQAGLPEDAVHELGRLIGRAGAQMADAILEVFLRTFLRPGDSEPDVALRFAQLAERLTPTIAPLTATPVRLHIKQRLRHEFVDAAGRAGQPPGMQPVAVGFADLVGFTALAASASAAELSRISARLEILAAGVAGGRVRLVKLIGDAAMFAAPGAEDLAPALSELIAAARADGVLPPLRAGLAAGAALCHGGDWYGPPVNLASRITEVAPAGQVVAEAAAARASALRWRPLGPRRLKGIADPVELFACDGS